MHAYTLCAGFRRFLVYAEGRNSFLADGTLGISFSAGTGRCVLLVALLCWAVWIRSGVLIFFICSRNLSAIDCRRPRSLAFSALSQMVWFTSAQHGMVSSNCRHGHVLKHGGTLPQQRAKDQLLIEKFHRNSNAGLQGPNLTCPRQASSQDRDWEGIGVLPPCWKLTILHFFVQTLLWQLHLKNLAGLTQSSRASRRWCRSEHSICGCG